MSAKQLGQFGEQVAADYLCEQGFEILARNWRGHRVELDIVAREGPTLVFCEVKTRSNTRSGLPLEAITPQKQQHLRVAALAWLCAHQIPHLDIRFDAIGILAPPKQTPSIDHLRGIQI
jgi:putative endonuclease